MALVLLVEAHRMMRSTLRDLLNEGGFESVAEAGDPAQAVHYVRHFSPDIIILDSNWHEFGGVYLTRILRELAPTSRIMLLVDDNRLTDPEIKRESGADAMVAKGDLERDLPTILDRWRLTEPSSEVTPPSTTS